MDVSKDGALGVAIALGFLMVFWVADRLAGGRTRKRSA